MNSKTGQKSLFGVSPWGAKSFRPALGECAPCKAMRLQAEAEEEFRKRFGVLRNVRPLQANGPRA